MNNELRLLIERTASAYFWIFLFSLILITLNCILHTEYWQKVEKNWENQVKLGIYKSNFNYFYFVLWILSIYYK